MPRSTEPGAPAATDVRVLVVDDDFMVARVNRGLVQRVAGFTVVGEAHTGAAALTAAARLRPDLVLLDIYLPDMSGLEVLRRLREAPGPEVDVLAVTAARDVATIRAAMRGGVVHYLIKPFTREALWERLDRYRRIDQRLSAGPEIGQAEVDRMFGGGRAEDLPKGLTPQTRELVGRALRAAGDLSATECGDLVGLSRVSARRYLEHLVETGEAEVRLRYGAAGRPERRYHWIGRS
ncbi:two-component system response regulator [Marinitenerispora sediminis]|uniref:Transcriptional regulatory protein n=2 Tax=Marinitenerispora sediminis TaxID=1931232 RepID=A0A368T8Z3_9ACTN|nr:two-component system response regulator [Marinitenerispora sediminis]RCV58989.1 two-component system response regulator [Marinitenerispora sediminis]RCV61297.1 two-component system response regulator [Marinitenerispora sediminis]